MKVTWRLKQILLTRIYGEEPPIEIVPYLPLCPVEATEKELAWAKAVALDVERRHTGVEFNLMVEVGERRMSPGEAASIHMERVRPKGWKRVGLAILNVLFGEW